MKFLKQNYIKWGLVMVGITTLCLFLMEINGNNKSFEGKPAIQTFLTMIAPFIVWFLGIGAKKKEQMNKLTYTEGLIEGSKISFVYGLVSPFVFMVYYLFINPEILSYVRTVYRLTGSSNFVVIGTDMLVQFGSAIVFGIIYAAIISLFLRSKS